MITKLFFAILLSSALTGCLGPTRSPQGYSSSPGTTASPSVPTVTTITVGTLDLGNLNTFRISPTTGRRVISPAPLTFAVPTYTDGSTHVVIMPIPPGTDVTGKATAQTTQIPNQGAQIDAINAEQVNLSFGLTNWNELTASATVTIQLGTQTQTVPSGTQTIVFSAVPGGSLPFSITINGALTENGVPIPKTLPGLLPVLLESVVEGTLHTHFFVLSVVYAPPGNALGGKSASTVSYASNTTTGSVFSSTQTTNNGSTFTVKADLLSGAVGSDVTTSIDTEDQSSVTTRTSLSRGLTTSGPPENGIDHGWDTIYFCLNPTVGIKIDPNKTVHWGIDLSGAVFEYAYVYQLKQPSTVLATENPGLFADLERAGFTQSDYTQMLLTDPFASGASAIDPKRFVPMGSSIPYYGAPSAAVAIQPTTITRQNILSTANTQSTGIQYKSAASYSVNAGFLDIFKTALSSTDTTQWTSKTSSENDTADTQTASITIGGASAGYNGPVDVLLYWDRIYGTFLFTFPTTDATVSGTVTDMGHPVANKTLIFASMGKTFQTLTDSKGRYRLYGTMPSAGTVTVAGQDFSVAASVNGAYPTLELRH